MQINLPKDTIPQQLDRTKLGEYNDWTRRYFSALNTLNDEPYILQDGPPYANNDFHLGHLLNKTLKDVQVKHQILNGKKVKFQFGFDCHGLPIELRANGDLNECVNIVDKYSKSQTQTANKFGIFGYGDPYFTMDNHFKTNVWYCFDVLRKTGGIYKDKKIVWYCPKLGTVLANSQLVYKDVKCDVIYPILDKFIVYTTTEWTLAANQALCLNPNIVYVETLEGLICSRKFATENDIKYFTVLDVLPTSYIGVDGSTKPILFDDFVTEQTGTGIVHLCGGHGQIDFDVLRKNNIAPQLVADDLSELNAHIDSYKFEGSVFKREEITHSYPFEERTEFPVFQVLSNQYFVRIDREKVISQVKSIKMSNKNRDKLSSYILERPEWCVSRQRKWGIPIPNSDDVLDVWFDSGCVFLLNNEPADLYIEGSDQYRGWFQSSVILSSLGGRQCTKQIFSHGFIIDEFKEKLSKSKGNFVALDELYDKYNPDVLRLWICLSDFKNDVVFSESSIHNATRQYFKIRNWLRYLKNNIYSVENNSVCDVQFDSLNKLVAELYSAFEYRKAFDVIFNYLQKYSSSLSEDVKNQFYESDLKSEFRLKMEREFQLVLDNTLTLLYPILPFLVSELLTTRK